MKRFASLCGSVGIVIALSLAMVSGINAADNDKSAQPASSAVGSKSPSGRPDWCRPNFECLPTSDVANATRQIIDLKEELIKAKGKRFGWTIGPSLGIVGVTTNTFDVKWVPAAGVAITWGLRSK